MSSPPTGILSYGWMPGPHPADALRDDAALVQSLHDLGQGAADAPDTVLPLDDADEPPQTALPPAAVMTYLPAASTAHPALEYGATPARDASSGWSADAQATRRLMVSLALVLGLFGVGLAFDYVYSGRQGHGAAQQAFEASVTQMQAAVARGDFAAAKQALGLVGTAHADDPRVQAARQALGQHEQAQAQRRERLQEAARRASLALGFHAPARPEPEPAAVDDSVHIVGAITPPPAAAAQPGACNPALVALALCQPANTARSGYAP
ncbi:hypothetical protein [Variovorax arabinosiphilus]|uniref:hypothetical protein n=1 Tax=Variovorax arabinosiphilus TaxID=3053498 RepID=UPI002576B4B1|nr:MULTISPECIES: hypothetical protein [unclassified Variovorax]MDM0120896.1 hypothetical protein [Variovorax sp. J2L1-78]MDM0129957.1 hypothetical protein [Variovorax sp. J2L1-63]MDM0233659.1 hypothetical protein [Variovorax sp. J2R1-6]